MSIAGLRDKRAVSAAPPAPRAPAPLAPTEPAAPIASAQPVGPPGAIAAAPVAERRYGPADLLVWPARLWISLTLRRYRSRGRPVAELGLECLRRFYRPELLEQTIVVPVDRVPAPPLRWLWSGKIPWDGVAGLTLRHTYFVRREEMHRQDLHAHELVHVIQWRLLGERAFLWAWLGDSLARGYHDNRLERIAYRVQNEFLDARQSFDVQTRVAELLVDEGLRLEA